MKLGREVSRHNELANWRNTHRFESVMATKWLLLTISETEPGLWDRLTWAMNMLRAGMPKEMIRRIAGWQKIPETYFRTLAAEDMARGHKEMSPADKLWGGPGLKRRHRPDGHRGDAGKPSSPSEDYLAVLAGQRQWIATTNFAGCPGRPQIALRIAPCSLPRQSS